ncbi:MAG: CDP-diacylglycerol--serine O-phosphatidyltransferase [Porticoccus sp.]
MGEESNNQSDLKQQTSLEDVIPVGEHEEEVSEGGKTVRHKGIYLLPNLFTLAAMFAGFYSVISAMNGHFEIAAIAIFIAMILDGLDGRIARMTNTQSAFGAEFDSLADMVSFGVAPALVSFTWALSSLGRIGWAVAFIYVAGTAIRLARFNTQIETADKSYFTGLASPAAAALVAGMVWICNDYGLVGEDLPLVVAILAAITTALAGVLMVTNIPYSSFKEIDFKARVPFVTILVVALGFAVITVDPPLILLVLFGGYALSGPVILIMKKAGRK